MVSGCLTTVIPNAEIVSILNIFVWYLSENVTLKLLSKNVTLLRRIFSPKEEIG
jgi:hypothetical protein